MKRGFVGLLGLTAVLLLLSACESETGSDDESSVGDCPAVGDLTVTSTNSIGAGLRCFIGGTLTQSATLPASTEWFIDGFVQVGSASSSPRLTIQPGTHIRGDRPTATSADYVYIFPGASLTAIGTRSAPIIFSSNDDNFELDSASSPAEWGGLIIADTASATFGENRLEYVIVAEGGAEVTPVSKSYTGNIVLDGLHDDTYLLFVQSHASAVDGINLLSDESPNLARIGWLLVTGASRDGFSYDNFSGLVKNLLVIHRPGTFDQSSGLGGRAGIFAGGMNSLPLFVNVSLVGRDAESAPSVTVEQREFGLIFDDDTSQVRMANMLIANFRHGCYEITGGADLSGISIDGVAFAFDEENANGLINGVIDGVHCGHEDTVNAIQVSKVLSGGDIPPTNMGKGLIAHAAGAITFRGEETPTILAGFTVRWLLSSMAGFDNTPPSGSSLVSELSTFNDGNTNNSTGNITLADKNFQPFLNLSDVFYGTVSGVGGSHLGYDLTRIGAVVSSSNTTTDPFHTWSLHSDFGEFRLDDFDP